METREKMMHDLQSLSFALVELNLFLDAHPDNKEALQYFKELNSQYNALVEKYSRLFGPLTAGSTENSDYFDWVATPWPWES